MRFLNQRTPGLYYLQIVKEHTDVWRLVTSINIQISAACYRDAGDHMLVAFLVIAHLLEAAAGGYIIELIIK